MLDLLRQSSDSREDSLVGEWRGDLFSLSLASSVEEKHRDL